jgi:hypothetical protein
MLVENSAICSACFDTISSNTPYKQETCSCGALSIGGGLQHPKVEGGDHVSMNWEMSDNVIKECIKAIGGATERTEIVLAVLRALRKTERIIADGEMRVIASRDNEVMICSDQCDYYRFKRVPDAE